MRSTVVAVSSNKQNMEIDENHENNNGEGQEHSHRPGSDSELKKEDLECCCCLYEYDISTHPPIISSSCSHSLCVHCIAKIWTRSSQRYSCPLCRAVIPCPESINYSLLASFHRDLPLISLSHSSASDNDTTPPFAFYFQEIKSAILSTGRLKEKFLCTTTHVATLRSAEVLVTTFTDCLQQETVLKPLIRELMLQLSQLRHENIAGYLGCATDSHFPEGQAIITERYPDSLSNKLFGQQSSPLSPFLRLDIALGISSGLAHIHNLHTHSPFASLPQDFPLSSLFLPRPLLHGNLTSENIQLLQQILPSGEVRYIAKISNIAIATTARRYLSAQAPSSMLFASATSAPPESRFGHYDQKSEVFSLGVILVELLTARPASAVMELMERGLASTNATGFQTRFKERYLDRGCLWDDKLWSGLFAIAKLCLKKSREERPDAAAVEGSLTALLQQLTTPPDAVPTPTAKAKTLLRKSSTGINAAAAVATARRQSSQSLSGRLSSASATGSTGSALPSSSSSRQRKLESAAASGPFTRRSNVTIAPQSRG